MDLSSCVQNFSLTVLVRIVALLIMQTDHLDCFCWREGEECSRELCPTKCNNKIDLQFLNLEKFSNYKRLLNVTALVLRFINNLKKSLNREEKVVQRYVTTEK